MSSNNEKSPISLLSELFYERETEFFGLTPYGLLDQIGTMIVDRYFDALSRLHAQELPNNCGFLSETQIAAALTQWTLLVETSIDKNFELFETYIMKNILALPADFPVDKFLEDFEVNVLCGASSGTFISASSHDLAELEDKMRTTMKRLKNVTLKNRKLKTEMDLIGRQERGLIHFEGHLACIKGLLQQYQIDSFEKSMSMFVTELRALKTIVQDTLVAGSDYLFAKYDAEVEAAVEEATSSSNNMMSDASSTSLSVNNDAYRRILSEMAGLSAAQTSEQIEFKRQDVARELTDRNKIASLSDFETFRAAVHRLAQHQPTTKSVITTTNPESNNIFLIA